MKNSKIAELRAQANNTSATVNTNTSNNTMTNIKSFEIVVNLILSATGASQGYFDKIQSEGNGCTLVKGRSLSRITATKDRESIFGTFLPLPETKTCKWNRNNNAVVIAHMEDGTSNILNTAQTKEFWRRGLNLPENADVSDFNFSVICDIPGYNADEADEMLRNNEARSLRIRFADGMPKYTVKEEDNKFTLRPFGANVDFSSTTVGADDGIITFNVDSSILNVKDDTSAQFDASRFSKSAKRREGRKAQSKAARQSVERVVYFDGAPVETPAVEVETPVVNAPVVDAEKEALRKENAELKAQVTELSANVANLTALMQQFMAAQAQPVAEPTPVVEEVTPEPVSEPEPEVVEEEEAPKTSKLEEFRRRAELEKAAQAKDAVESDDVANAFDFNFYDE